MAAEELLFIDIEPKSNICGPGEGRAEKLTWTCSDDTFRFNFLPESSPALQEKTSPSPGGCQTTASLISLTGPGSDFAFDFQIPPVENMETTDARDISSLSSQRHVREAKPSPPQGANPPPEPSLQSKAKKKKKKKSGRNNLSDAEAQQTPTSAEGGQGGGDPELSAEEQLNRQLDWCIEQLECSLGTQKIAPKQKEEASRALKTLRSSKAPLAKKRQVMRAMTGDYRKKMDEEKSRQHKLIQSEIASAQVKVVSKSPKKPLFHRRAEVKQAPGAGEKLDDVQDTDLNAKEETSAFVFTSSKEAFHFNFL
ncbi:UPF0488 protein C8orf33 homolog [Pungitius pungitius]|uniref:UPF0488 protein C8orf33 homolog n=1 Tax=Pungitius pungitius TaxID=134920 RepID=UPI002E10AD1E